VSRQKTHANPTDDESERATAQEDDGTGDAGAHTGQTCGGSIIGRERASGAFDACAAADQRLVLALQARAARLRSVTRRELTRSTGLAVALTHRAIGCTGDTVATDTLPAQRLERADRTGLTEGLSGQVLVLTGGTCEQQQTKNGSVCEIRDSNKGMTRRMRRPQVWGST
jgi:hypothetical protein